MSKQQFQFQKTKLQIKLDQKLGQTSTPILLDCCTLQKHIISLLSFKLFFFFEELYIKLPFWSGSNLLKLACSSASYPTATRHWNPCRIWMAGMWRRWSTATDEKGVNKMEEMIIGNYTGETHHRAHTPLMQTAVLQENTEIWECFCND